MAKQTSHHPTGSRVCSATSRGVGFNILLKGHDLLVKSEAILARRQFPRRACIGPFPMRMLFDTDVRTPVVVRVAEEEQQPFIL